jgi:hypothetical protein
MLANKGKKILFFIAGLKPTDEEFAAAKNIGTFMFRNSKVAAESRLESADAVTGLVPSKEAMADEKVQAFAERLRSIFERYKKARTQVIEAAAPKALPPDKK